MNSLLFRAQMKLNLRTDNPETYGLLLHGTPTDAKFIRDSIEYLQNML